MTHYPEHHALQRAPSLKFFCSSVSLAPFSFQLVFLEIIAFTPRHQVAALLCGPLNGVRPFRTCYLTRAIRTQEICEERHSPRITGKEPPLRTPRLSPLSADPPPMPGPSITRSQTLARFLCSPDCNLSCVLEI